MCAQPPLLQVSEAEFDDLRRRLRATRWPESWPLEAWAAGTDRGELERLVGYWADGYDWQRWQSVINELPSHFA